MDETYMRTPSRDGTDDVIGEPLDLTQVMALRR
jgi:hypothetical protein